MENTKGEQVVPKDREPYDERCESPSLYCGICDSSMEKWTRGVGTPESPHRIESSICSTCADPDNAEEARQVFGWVQSFGQ